MRAAAVVRARVVKQQSDSIGQSVFGIRGKRRNRQLTAVGRLEGAKKDNGAISSLNGHCHSKTKRSLHDTEDGRRRGFCHSNFLGNWAGLERRRQGGEGCDVTCGAAGEEVLALTSYDQSSNPGFPAAAPAKSVGASCNVQGKPGGEG